ncbi:MAG: hypothetical protein QM763_02215 [Agriterribacter sp.]
MKQIFGVLAVLLIHFTASAGKYHKAKITFQDGRIVEGLAEMLGTPSPTPISFKESKDSKRQSLKCDDIKNITYYLNDNKTLEYDRMNIYFFESDKKPSKMWLQVLQRGPVTLYSFTKLDPAGAFGGRDQFEELWFCYRAGEDVATRISSSYIKNKKGYFLQKISQYFRDDVELVKNIENEQYKWNDMKEIVEAYNAKRK